MRLAHASTDRCAPPRLTALPHAGLWPRCRCCAGSGPAWRLAAGAPNRPVRSALSSRRLVALLLVGRLLGEAMQRIGQPAVMGQLLAGLLLGPSVLGALWPELQHALFPATPSRRR